MKNKIIIFGIAMAIAYLMNVSYASPIVKIDEIEILNDKIFVGDVLDVAVDFNIVAEKTQFVRLSLYIDNKIKDTHTSYYSDGKFTYNFHYDMEMLSSGNHDLKIKIDVLKDDKTIDSASQTELFNIEQISTSVYHNIKIIDIKIPKKANPNTEIPIILTIENTGAVDEANMIAEIEIDSKKYKCDYFYLDKKQKKIVTSHIITPLQKGEYQINIKVKNPYVMDKATANLNIEDISVIFKTNTINESVDKYIFVYGYVRQETPNKEYIYIYHDNVYETKIMPDRDGYFSYFSKFEEEGEHIISTKIYGIKNDIKVNTYEPEIFVPEINQSNQTEDDEVTDEQTDRQRNETANQTTDQNITGENQTNMTGPTGHFINIDNIEEKGLFVIAIILLLLLLVLYETTNPKAIKIKQEPEKVSKPIKQNILPVKSIDEKTPVFPIKPTKSFAQQKEEKQKIEKAKEEAIPEIEDISEIPEPTEAVHWVSFRNIIR